MSGPHKTGGTGRGGMAADGFRPLRLVPGLFIGRRRLVAGGASWRGGHEGFLCGACGAVVVRESRRDQLADVVVRCACGAHNQL